MSGNRIFVASETFSVNGYETFHKDRTRVREGHPLLAQFPGHFRVADAHHEWPEVEAATAGPGERRGEKVAR